MVFYRKDSRTFARLGIAELREALAHVPETYVVEPNRMGNLAISGPGPAFWYVGWIDLGTGEVIKLPGFAEGGHKLDFDQLDEAVRKNHPHDWLAGDPPVGPGIR